MYICVLCVCAYMCMHVCVYVCAHACTCVYRMYICVADTNKDRREMVRKKTSEYLLYAESLQKRITTTTTTTSGQHTSGGGMETSEPQV